MAENQEITNSLLTNLASLEASIHGQYQDEIAKLQSKLDAAEKRGAALETEIAPHREWLELLSVPTPEKLEIRDFPKPLLKRLNELAIILYKTTASSNRWGPAKGVGEARKRMIIDVLTYLCGFGFDGTPIPIRQAYLFQMVNNHDFKINDAPELVEK